MDVEKSKIQELEAKARVLILEELASSNINYDFLGIKVYPFCSVGVQGDNRTYKHPVELEIRKEGKIFWDADFLARLSSKIPNNISEINRVVYVI